MTGQFARLVLNEALHYHHQFLTVLDWKYFLLSALPQNSRFSPNLDVLVSRVKYVDVSVVGFSAISTLLVESSEFPENV